MGEGSRPTPNGLEDAAVLLPRPSDKSLLDISVDFMEPLFGALGPLLVSLGVGFQLRDPIFGRAKLVGKLLSHIKRLLTICFGHSGCLMKQPHNSLTSRI